MSVPQSSRDLVPPGNETGVYYIPISNLPFNASWQQLKDFVRQVCTVDRVEIFPKSTSGWVRVRGLENFQSAFGKLNGGEFNGRALIADGRNDKSPVRIRDLMLPSSRAPGEQVGGSSDILRSPSYSTADSLSWSPPPPQSQPLSNISNSSYGAYTTPNMSPGLTYMRSPEQHYTYPGSSSYDMPASYSQAPPTSMPTSFSYAQTAPYYGYSSPPSADQYSYGSASGSGAGGDYYASYKDPPGTQPPPGLAPTAPPGGLIRTEQRGVHIREISRRVTQAAVEKMLRDTAGSNDASLIVEIKVPLDKDHSPKGWATMMFSSGEAAQRMVGRLNKIEFKGRKLQAKIFKEGEAVGVAGSSSGSHHHQHHHHHQKEGGKKDRKDKGGSSSKGSSSKDDGRKDKDKKDSKKSVVIAHGSSYIKGNADKRRSN